MLGFIRNVFLGVIACAIVSATSSYAAAGTIIKLNLGNVSPDIVYDGVTLSTEDDGNASPGDQNTAVEFLEVLEPAHADIPGNDASFSLNGLTPVGQAFVLFGSSILQNFTGGTFSLYDTDNTTLLLSGTLDDSALTGPIGFSGGGLFTTTFGSFTGGTLSSYLDPNTLVLAMHFTGVQTTGGGVGLTASNITGSVPVQNGDLNPFTADASIGIEGEVPEPATIALVLAGVALVAAGRKRNRLIA